MAGYSLEDFGGSGVAWPSGLRYSHLGVHQVSNSAGDTLISKVFRRIAWHVAPVLAALLTFVLAKEIDTRAFPVVTDFVVLNMRDDGSGVVVDGTMHKRRDCRFLEVVAYGDVSAPVHIKFLDRLEGSQPFTRAVRVQLWGPWRIEPDGSKIVTLVARHACHSLWDHSTVLTSFAVKGAA